MPRRRFFLLFLIAWAIRGYWMSVLDPPSEHLFSDMATYVHLARKLGTSSVPDENLIFFPFGMPMFLAICFYVAQILGYDEFAIVAAVLSMLLALQVPLSAAIAVCCGASVRSGTLLGLWLCIWPPSLLQSSYLLSEHIFCTGMLFCIWLWSRTNGKSGIWSAAVGMSAALTCFVRPQFLLGVALASLAVVIQRRGRLGYGTWFVAALLSVLSLGVARAYWHSGTPHFVSSNAGVNLVFGTCHSRRVVIRDEDRVIADFSPPVLAQMYKKGLAPTGSSEHTLRMDEGLQVSKHFAVAEECFRRTPWPEFLRHRALHVTWLFTGNRMWPSSTNENAWLWLDVSERVLLVLALPSLFIVTFVSSLRRNETTLILIGQIVSLLLVAMVFFGSARLRSSYDAILMILTVVAAGHCKRTCASHPEAA